MDICPAHAKVACRNEQKVYERRRLNIAMRGRGFYFETRNGTLYYYDDSNGCVTIAENGQEKGIDDSGKFLGESTDITVEVAHGFELAKEKAMQEITSKLENDGYNQLILTTTYDCNLRCRYCVHSGNYENKRVHQPIFMTEEVAKAAIKWYLDTFRRVKERNPRKIPTIGFYGGEPMLSIDLMKQAVGYAKELYGGKILFNLTTNGTLLFGEVVDFLVENGFAVIITLNGAKAEHDRLRVFPDGAGSFDIIWDNLMKLCERYPAYYKDNCSLVVDYDFGTDLNFLRSFFEQYAEIMPEITTVSPILTFFTKWYEQYSIEQRRKFADSLIACHQEYLSELTKGRDSSLFVQGMVRQVYDLILRRSQNSATEGHILSYTGTCCPGAKIAVDPYGNFHCCERINEHFPIGNINVGLDMQRIVQMVDMYHKQILPGCLDCSVTMLCPVCFATVGKNGNFERNPVDFCDGIQADIRKLFTALWSAMEEPGAKKPSIVGAGRTLRVDTCIKKG